MYKTIVSPISVDLPAIFTYMKTVEKDRSAIPQQLRGYFINAAISGGVCAAVSASLNGVDVTKIRLQNQNTGYLGSNIRYSGMISSMKKIFREEGWRGLMQGVEASMLREISYSSVRMGLYEPIRAALSARREDDAVHASPQVKFFSALLSGGIGSALANPFDLMKTRFQSALPGQPRPYSSTLAGLRTVFRDEGGLRGLYRGWAVTSARAAVLTSAQLGSYDSIKHNLLMDRAGMQEGFALHLAASMSAGLITTTAANPLDVIKTRYLSDIQRRYSSPADCVLQTFRSEGLAGFLKGWTPAYWRLGPHTVLSLLIIEHIRSAIGMHTI